jgi:hypothetical protein
MRYQTGKFFVVGCFCSLECACSYNFQSCGNNDSLLNALSVQLGGPRVVASAPARLALTMFGGHMSIDDFRAHTYVDGLTSGGTTAGGAAVAAGGGGGSGSGSGRGSSRRLIINSPPMHCVSQHIEEVSDMDMMSEYRYIPLDTDRVTRYQERIRLSRTKPLINYKNTLDHSMKVQYLHHNRA